MKGKMRRTCAPHAISVRITADGCSRAELLRAVSRAVEIAVPGSSVHAFRPAQPHGQTVFLVKYPEEWTPALAGDLPMNVERHIEPTEIEADAFVRGFNNSELEQPSGWWAVV